MEPALRADERNVAAAGGVNVGGLAAGLGAGGQRAVRQRALCNEDMERSSEEKAAAVHFLRFELSGETIQALRRGAALSMGIDHPELPYRVAVAAGARAALLRDLS